MIASCQYDVCRDRGKQPIEESQKAIYQGHPQSSRRKCFESIEYDRGDGHGSALEDSVGKNSKGVVGD